MPRSVLFVFKWEFKSPHYFPSARSSLLIIFHLSGLGTPAIHFFVPQCKFLVCDYLWQVFLQKHPHLHIVIMFVFFHLLSGLHFNAQALLKATNNMQICLKNLGCFVLLLSLCWCWFALWKYRLLILSFNMFSSVFQIALCEGEKHNLCVIKAQLSQRGLFPSAELADAFRGRQHPGA